MRKVSSSCRLVLLLLCLAACGASGTGCAHYDYTVEAGPVQIGCLFQLESYPEGTPPYMCFRMGFPWWFREAQTYTGQKDMALQSINGLLFSPFLDVDCGDVNGIACAGVLLRGGTVRGFALSPFLTLCYATEGVSVAVLNWATRKAWWQIGIMNLCFLPWEDGYAGMQTGLVNGSGHAFFQFGLLNAISEPEGPALQIGLLNQIEKDALLFEWFPLVNISAGGASH